MGLYLPFDIWSDPLLNPILGIVAIAFAVFAVGLTIRYERIHRTRHHQLLVAASGKTVHYEKFEVVQDIFDLKGGSTRVSNIVLVNIGEKDRKEALHTVWHTEPGSGIEVWAATRHGRKLETRIVTATPSYQTVAVQFPGQGIRPHKSFDYSFFVKNPNGFPKLMEGEWAETRVETYVEDFRFAIKLPPGTKFAQATCSAIKAETERLELSHRVDRDGRSRMEVGVKGAQEGVLYRIEFRAERVNP
jgi:hypothetical protein